MMAKQEQVGRRFEVDATGFKNEQVAREPFRLVQEIISDGFDEDSASKLSILIGYNSRKKVVTVNYRDDGIGFKRISDAWTLHGYSERIKDPRKRGRFNLGLKYFFAAVVVGHVVSSGKRVDFLRGDRRTVESCSGDGTTIYGELVFGISHLDEIIRQLNRIIVPKDKTLTVNGTEIPHKTAIRSFETTLQTEVASEANPRMRARYDRKTSIGLYPVEQGKKAFLYELGVPVQHIKCMWNIDVGQKIPQNPNRDTVSTAYLEKLFAAILNNCYDLIPAEKAGSNWISSSLFESSQDAAKDIVRKMYGTDKIYFESKDNYRANERACEAGGRLIPLGLLDGDTRRHLEEIHVVEYASKVFKTDLADSAPVEPTSKMLQFAEVVKRIAKDTLCHEISVGFFSSPDATELANYAREMRHLAFNVAILGGQFFDSFSPKGVAIIIHELAHDKEHTENFAHLSASFVDEVCRIAGIISVKGIEYYGGITELSTCVLPTRTEDSVISSSP